MEHAVDINELAKRIDSLKTPSVDKTVFWQKIKDTRYEHNQSHINSVNLLIDSNKEQAESFIEEYKKANPPYDFCCNHDVEDLILSQEEWKAKKILHKENNYPDVGIPIIDIKIDVFDLKTIYTSFLQAIHIKPNSNINKNEDLILYYIRTLGIESVFINYYGEQLKGSKKIYDVLYALCRLGEIAKIGIHTFGDIPINIFYNERRNIPIGQYVKLQTSEV